MGEVIRLKRARKETIRGAARSCITDAFASVPAAHGIVVVVLGGDGSFALRSANYDTLADFDMYSRAGALIDQRRMKLLADR